MSGCRRLAAADFSHSRSSSAVAGWVIAVESLIWTSSLLSEYEAFSGRKPQASVLCEIRH